MVPDLCAGVAELHRGLLDASVRGDALDAYLFAAGIVQVCEDRLNGTPWLLSRAAQQLEDTAARPLVRLVLNSAVATAGLTPASRCLRSWLSVVRQLTDALASAVTAGSYGTAHRGAFTGRVSTLLERLGTEGPEPAAALLEGSTLRSPSCFRSFDQHPRDVLELVARFIDRYPDRSRRLMVIGLRTSGSYLAPLTGAALRAEGYARVAVRTTRPAGAGSRADHAELRSALRDGALVLLIDDPPRSGDSLATVAQGLLRTGFPAERVVMLFAAFDDRPVPAPIAAHPSVVLPPGDWYIRERLRKQGLHRTLAALLPDHEVLGLSAAEPGHPSRWSHLEVPFTVLAHTDRGDREMHLVAQGAGTGYFGRHSLAAARALDGLVPQVHGFHDGVLLWERQPAEPGRSSDPVPTELVPAADVLRYVIERRERLPLNEDRSPLLTGRQPVWEVGARLFAHRCGRLAAPLRPLLIDPLLRELLRTSSASLADGHMVFGRWWHGPEGWTKTDFDDGHFSHLDLAEYDAAYDLAGATQALPEHEDQLLADYERLTGTRVPAARWCVYGAALGWNAERLLCSGAGTGMDEAAARRARSRAVQRYLAGLYLGDLDDVTFAASSAPPSQAWCVLDVDGVLESDLFGVAAPSPTGMLALRGLRAHGYQVLLATGRPVPEVRDRCRVYGLLGGVAEYGAVVYDAERDHCAPLVTGHGRSALARVLSGLPSVTLDSQYRVCLRACRGCGAGRTALDARTVRQVSGGQEAVGFTAVQGETQTDFVPVGVDKWTGLEALLERLGAPPGTRPVLAVGDSATDIPLLRRARYGCAPGNAAPAVRAAGLPVLRRPYQVGLADAVGRLLGHVPGSCPVCCAPALSPADAALTALLAVSEAGWAGMPGRLARFARARAAMAGSSGTDGPAAAAPAPGAAAVGPQRRS
ncbi:HAD family hydrolase [Streptomyces guryensis]|uniref:HAD hydrolase family protein n=1 Tax=Streptomyces guryensis TaxID=2886947 RepID=A0A9Q3VUY7_9ACTN|nr:HAD hydrolase family protein [Streptomyces guryensis]MCD9877836.1 HAD hydrolase family protein [Streptomyces guryensis]